MQTKKKKIGFFDSGIGGTTILKPAKKALSTKQYQFKYIADSKNCPYGEKNDEELFRIVDNNVKSLIEWGTDTIVIACNTATTRCMNFLKEKYPNMNFIGTEPAVKDATKTGAKKILIMATPGTIKSVRLKELIEDNQKPGQEIVPLACPGLAKAIENKRGIKKVLGQILKNVDRDFDVVVLGCTHYPLAKKQLKKFFPISQFVDSSSNVVAELENVLKSNMLK